MPNLIQTSTDGLVRTLRLNRPDKRNALNAELVTALKNDLDAAEEDASLRAIVLTGAGSAFSAGADLSSLRAMREAGPTANQKDSRHLAELFRRIYQSSIPVIAKVNGHAIGGGCGLASVCDFAYVSEGARLGFSEVRIGFVPAIVMVFLRRKLGETQTRNLLLRGRLVDASRAAEMGLVTRVVSEDELDEAVGNLAHELARETSGSAVALTKQMLARVPGMGLDEALDYAVQMNAFARGTDDCQAGIEAFLNDEDPPWKQEAQG
ncbi:enoyl-CoA hydratase/isomerase family protein [Salinibacter grassmerensis]|uniref:enoyl-CoA hydratase/isomerase family protein n=1 Tax=Salinibacter grassmerensis TaxID=3040353 RepID=UPI0021E80CF3|nr:enoyl-CoA hydratase/isomerase family protein [Salinibacter grassmerensis]